MTRPQLNKINPHGVFGSSWILYDDYIGKGCTGYSATGYPDPAFWKPDIQPQNQYSVQPYKVYILYILLYWEKYVTSWQLFRSNLHRYFEPDDWKFGEIFELPTLLR